jgi:hypothetical protein
MLMDYRFEEVQPLKIAVFDRDGPTEDLSRHDFIGDVETTLGTIIGRCVDVARARVLHVRACALCVVGAQACERVQRGA